MCVCEMGKQIFHSTHYVGEDLIMKFEEGEAWKKVLGPVFIYLNSFPKEVDPLLLWHEAKNQVCYKCTCTYVRITEI